VLADPEQRAQKRQLAPAEATLAVGRQQQQQQQRRGGEILIP
jgi:hypothetical protein